MYHRGTEEQFNTWHNPIKIEKGYPITGRNALTGKLEPTKCKTTDYSEKMAHPTNLNDYIWFYGDYKSELSDLTKQEAESAKFFQGEE